MKLSEYIKGCLQLVQEHGDHELVYDEGDFVTNLPEYDVGGEGQEPAFVIST